MRRTIMLALVVAMVSLLTVGPVFAAPGSTDPSAAQDLAAARNATAKYHDIDNAIADGFIPAGGCVEIPGTGAMGVHYINPARIFDPSVDPTEPEALLYIPTASGLRLVGVEYFVAIGSPGGPVPVPAPPAPSLFGRTFDGPMLGHDPAMPPHYDLHVWLWQANPNGVFEQFNPKLSC